MPESTLLVSATVGSESKPDSRAQALLTLCTTLSIEVPSRSLFQRVAKVTDAHKKERSVMVFYRWLVMLLQKMVSDAYANKVSSGCARDGQ